MKILVRLLAIVLTAVPSSLYAVTIYKCIDASGAVTFSQEPCEEGTASETLSIDVQPTGNAGTLGQQIQAMDLKVDTSMCRRKIKDIDTRIERLLKNRDAEVARLMAERVDSYDEKVLFDEYRNIDEQIYQIKNECSEKVEKLREQRADYEARLADLEEQAADLPE